MVITIDSFSIENIYLFCRKSYQDTVNNLIGYKKLGTQLLDVNWVNIKGTCCAKIFIGKIFRGKSQKLYVGFNDAPNFRKIRSVIFGVCNDI